MNLLTVSGSPHIHSGNSVKKIMWGVVIALIPAMLVSFYFFGLGAINITLIAVVSCLLFEFLIQRFIMKTAVTITDGSAVITGILLAFTVPSSLPFYMVIIGSLIAIGVGKMTFGGLGKNPFNPALVGRVFLLISFPVDMTTWPKPLESAQQLSDVISGPTPLGLMKEGLKSGETVSTMLHDANMPDYIDQLVGNVTGSIGEVSAIAIVVGGIYLLIRKIITWHIPVSFLLSVVVFAGIFWLIDDSKYVDPLFHVITGGIMLGAFFMATDMVTSPMSKMGQILFGIGCGLLTMIIRMFGAYPEGVSFAILIMNAFVPLINSGMKPKRFGEKVQS
ncbi:MAG: RnfABCDGE type electron transport complex subunit D [Bacteroidetes bacterium]|nr:RnfABCDGE type electron transport complex subunit D [Bacteroidota bacterium]MBU1719555.1 RnfABCDGE type electron transport complex subunit D [Bacteroidota bacterium]